MNQSAFLTIGKLLNGTKSMISAIDKVLPLYTEIKPLFSKIRSITNKMQNFDLSKFKLVKNEVKENPSEVEKKKDIKYPSSTPQFFI